MNGVEKLSQPLGLQKIEIPEPLKAAFLEYKKKKLDNLPRDQRTDDNYTLYEQQYPLVSLLPNTLERIEEIASQTLIDAPSAFALMDLIKKINEGLDVAESEGLDVKSFREEILKYFSSIMAKALQSALEQLATNIELVERRETEIEKDPQLVEGSDEKRKWSNLSFALGNHLYYFPEFFTLAAELGFVLPPEIEQDFRGLSKRFMHESDERLDDIIAKARSKEE
ncbi:MAG: hypothetical protein V4467_04625 [Patescibacteria group bacterium]